jgi:alginate O-acetyltransferase complex protein AlgI
MLFSSPAFVLFFAAYYMLHRLVPVRHRLALIVVGSSVFYAYWNPYYLWIPLAFVLIAFHGTIWMAEAPEASRRRRLAALIALILMPLLAIKYSAFVYNNLFGLVFGSTPWIAPWPLPLGISFITFTLIAYVVDVYQGRYAVERSARMLAGLVLFFPHLIAGPILRPAELLPQLHHAQPGRAPQSYLGIAIFTFGLVKKVVFADSFGEVVERVFAPRSGAALSAADYLLAIYGFSLQIYCDFSGYTDMAIGAALVLGVKLPENFQRPYAAVSITEFWRRWHITLSRWLRDYIYIPLGGNRNGYARQMLNLLLTMAIGGLWHGANWTFVLWGVAHGAGLAFVRTLHRFRLLQHLSRIPRPLAILVTFHFVTALWILFRAPDLATAWRVAAGPFAAPWTQPAVFAAQNAFPLMLLGAFLLLHPWDSHPTMQGLVQRLPVAVSLPVLVVLWMLAVAVSHGSSAKFIYFDF